MTDDGHSAASPRMSVCVQILQPVNSQKLKGKQTENAILRMDTYESQANSMNNRHATTDALHWGSQTSRTASFITLIVRKGKGKHLFGHQSLVACKLSLLAQLKVHSTVWST